MFEEFELPDRERHRMTFKIAALGASSSPS
jgi:hypothetical protein